RSSPARAVEVGRRRGVSRARAAVLGVAALRAAAARLPGGTDAARARGGGGNDAAAEAGDRDAPVAEAHRAAGDRTAPPRRALAARAEKQHMRTIDAPGVRGDIVDRRGRVLATSVDADTIYAVPSEIVDARGAVAQLCAALGDCTDKDRQLLVDRLGQQKAFA